MIVTLKGDDSHPNFLSPPLPSLPPSMHPSIIKESGNCVCMTENMFRMISDNCGHLLQDIPAAGCLNMGADELQALGESCIGLQGRYVLWYPWDRWMLVMMRYFIQQSLYINYVELCVAHFATLACRVFKDVVCIDIHRCLVWVYLIEKFPIFLSWFVRWKSNQIDLLGA